jgi:hypothetical protein
MTDPWRTGCAVVVLLVLGFMAGTAQAPKPSTQERPTLVVRITPPTGFTPLRVRATAEARNGSDDYEEFYCATVEWDWGDGTISENTGDCDPYEAGKSMIQRRFTADHVYRQAGSYRIAFRLKQKTRQVGGAVASVQVRSGAGEGFDR